MRITMSTQTPSPSGGSGSKKAAIARQIRQLEQKRDELLEQLGALNKGTSSKTSDISQGTLSGGTQSTMTQSVQTTLMGETSQEENSGPVVNNDALLIKMARSALFDQQSSSSGNEYDIPMKPEDIMKMIEVINIQIMNLQQQLCEDGELLPLSLDAAGEEEAPDPVATVQARTAKAIQESTVPDVSPTTEGGVDGYA